MARLISGKESSGIVGKYAFCVKTNNDCHMIIKRNKNNTFKSLGLLIIALNGFKISKLSFPQNTIAACTTTSAMS